MKEFEETYEKWRKMLLQTNLYLAVLIFIVEFIMYFLLKESHLIFQNTSYYLTHYFIIPSIVNFSSILVGYIMQKYIALDSKFINYIPAVQQVCICTVIASTHYIFSVTLCVFCIPLFTTLIFNDQKMTRNVGVLCYAGLACALLSRRFMQIRFKADVYFFPEAIVAFMILMAASIIIQVFIQFQDEKSNIIRQGYLKQLEMKEQLTKDQKTGLYGHTVFMNKLDQMIEAQIKTKIAIALAIIDIDDFKRINDTYGHLQGDQVILRLAELLKKNQVANRYIARFGGEEFAIIFTENEVRKCFHYLEKIRIEFEKQKYSFINDKITISIGIAIWRSGVTSEQLFNNADAAMYASKLNGKNQTKLYGSKLETVFGNNS